MSEGGVLGASIREPMAHRFIDPDASKINTVSTLAGQRVAGGEACRGQSGIRHSGPRW